MKVIEFLKGKKTFIVALVSAVFNLLVVFNYVTVTPDQLLAINGVLVALGGAAIRLGINNQ
jgi:hypothetical protein